MTGKKNIEYSEKSWNPYTGCRGIEQDTCAVGKKCWAYRRSLMLAGNPMVKGYDKKEPFKPTFHSDKLDIPFNRKKPTTWNVSFMGDIAYANRRWLISILNIVNECPQHRFIFLTKRPDLLAEKDLDFPDNCIVGVTVNFMEDTWRLANILNVKCKYRWASFEPVYSAILTNLKGLDWVVIGAQTNPDKQPENEWVEYIIKSALYREIPVFLKPNLKGFPTLQELPAMLRRD